MKSVEANSILVSWKAGPGTLAPNIKWYTVSEANHPTIAFTTRVPSDVQVYNLTPSQPATHYKVCVDVRSINYNHDTKCVNVTTKGNRAGSQGYGKMGCSSNYCLWCALGRDLSGLPAYLCLSEEPPPLRGYKEMRLQSSAETSGSYRYALSFLYKAVGFGEGTAKWSGSESHSHKCIWQCLLRRAAL